jgi:GTPase SAR1 family protein
MDSLRAARALYEKIIRVKEDPEPAVVVVGNKCDLTKHRQVSSIEAKDLAIRCDSPHLETSGLYCIAFPIPFSSSKYSPSHLITAKTRINVEEAFAELVRRMRLKCGPEPKMEDEKTVKSTKNKCVVT